MFNVMLPRFDIKITFDNPSNPKNFSNAKKILDHFLQNPR